MWPLLGTRMLFPHRLPECHLRSCECSNVRRLHVTPDILLHAGHECLLQHFAASVPVAGLFRRSLSGSRVDAFPYSTEISKPSRSKRVVGEVRQPPDRRLGHKTRIRLTPPMY